MANPIKTVEAHTPKTISEEIRRSCTAMGGYKIVGENRVMSVSRSIPSNRDYVAGKAPRFECTGSRWPVGGVVARLTPQLAEYAIGSDGFETFRFFRFRLALAFPRIVLRNSGLAPSWGMRLASPDISH